MFCRSSMPTSRCRKSERRDDVWAGKSYVSVPLPALPRTEPWMIQVLRAWAPTCPHRHAGRRSTKLAPVTPRAAGDLTPKELRRQQWVALPPLVADRQVVCPSEFGLTERRAAEPSSTFRSRSRARARRDGADAFSTDESKGRPALTREHSLVCCIDLAALDRILQQGGRAKVK